MKIDKDAHVQARKVQAPNEDMQYTTFHSHPKVLKKQDKIHINILLQYFSELGYHTPIDFGLLWQEKTYFKESGYQLCIFSILKLFLDDES